MPAWCGLEDDAGEEERHLFIDQNAELLSHFLLLSDLVRKLLYKLIFAREHLMALIVDGFLGKFHIHQFLCVSVNQSSRFLQAKFEILSKLQNAGVLGAYLGDYIFRGDLLVML